MRHTPFLTALALSAGLLLCACATPPRAPPEVLAGAAAPPALAPAPVEVGAPPPMLGSSGPPGASAGAAREAADYSIVRYVGVDASAWQPAKQPAAYADLYTRLELQGRDDLGAGQGHPAYRDYQAENRPWISRIWSDKTNTITLVATINAADPALAVTLPLFSATYASGPKLGDTWTTNYTASDVHSPLFRISPNTALTVHLAAKVSSDVKSQGAAMAIGAVTRAVQIAAPSSTLLTALSSAEIRNTASALDTALSSILSQDISEDIALGRLTDSWSPDSAIVITGCAPFLKFEGVSGAGQGCGAARDIDRGYDTPVGGWSLKLTCPRPSVFDARDICHPIGAAAPVGQVIDWSLAANRAAVQAAIAGAASDAEILSFPLSSQTDVQTFVQSQPWYAGFISTAAPAAADYTAFCAGAITGMEHSSLNSLDAALVLRAVIDQMPKVTARKAGFTAAATGQACQEMLRAVQVSLS